MKILESGKIDNFSVESNFKIPTNFVRTFKNLPQKNQRTSWRFFFFFLYWSVHFFIGLNSEWIILKMKWGRNTMLNAFYSRTYIVLQLEDANTFKQTKMTEKTLWGSFQKVDLLLSYDNKLSNENTKCKIHWDCNQSNTDYKERKIEILPKHSRYL